MADVDGAMETDSFHAARSPASSPLDDTTTPRPRRVRRTRATCPDPGSLYDIMRANSGASLFVLPILWTDVHARLLRADFVPQEPAAPLTPASSSSSSSSSLRRGSHPAPRPSAVAEALSFDLTSLLCADDTRAFTKSRAIKSVLSTLYLSAFSRAKSAAELDLHFGDRVFRGAVRVPVVWKGAIARDNNDGDNATPDFASFDSAATRPLPSPYGHAASGARETNDYFSSRSSSQRSAGASGAAAAAAATAATTDGPLLAYINRSHLALIRQNLFRIAPGPRGGDHQNTPVARLQSLRSRMLVPCDLDRDAYLVGVFVALAQAHFYDNYSNDEFLPRWASTSSCWWANNKNNGSGGSGHYGRNGNRNNSGRTTACVPDFHDVTLRILTHDDTTSDFIVYTAVVTAAFLQRFAAPTQATPDVQASQLRITYVRVPVWPVLGLKVRLGHALGRDLVGDDLEDDDNSLLFADKTSDDDDDDAATTETFYESQDERARRLGSLKRKRTERHTLADVLQATLEADSSASMTSNNSSNSNNNNSIVSDAAVSSSSISGSGSGSGGVPANSSPALSPRGKRRQTRSLSSLAVC
ncbi:hypothetical protein SPI_07217 [Niveomyces insectorum RCEF 264]|uniref:Uncharacterized protein n=1 Tax=Niveomyces insectorum RCEF 264 TaxID=1081102 RepID=A0A167QE55_9HYPO|nr:hypothetical protein SPI_07217 [Niveomyces insectorum RCEF 264]